MLLGQLARLLINRADLNDRLQSGGALKQHQQLLMRMGNKNYLQRLRRSADACLHLRLLKNELHGIGTKRIVNRAQRHAVRIAALLRQCPLETVRAVDTNNLVLPMRQQVV